MSISWPQALAFRMHRQFLDPAAGGSVEDVVRRLGGVPSKDETMAELAIRRRRSDSQPGDVAAAMADGTVVKAFAFRGGVHYLSAEDGGAYLALRASGRQWERASWQEFYALTPEAWPDFRAAVRDALTDRPLTIGELGTALARTAAYKHLLPVFEDGAGTLMKPLTWLGDMGFGAPRDGQATFQRLDTNPRWKGGWELEEAGPHAIATYVGGYGPVTRANLDYRLVECLSVRRTLIDGWLETLGTRLSVVDVDGTDAYVLAEDVDDLMAARASKAVRLLPGHDLWVMGVGTKDEHAVPPEHRQPMTNGLNPVLVGGALSGTWSRKRGEIAISWFEGARKPTAAILDAEVAAVTELLGD